MEEERIQSVKDVRSHLVGTLCVRLLPALFFVVAEKVILISL